MELRNKYEGSVGSTESFTLQDYWSLAVSRKWLILGIVLASLIVSGILCVVIPKSYRSSTLILVEDQKIPEDYVKAIIGRNIEERLAMIEQQVMSRTRLGRIIEEFNLYQDDIRQDGLESVIERMRKTIQVDTVGTPGSRGKSVEAFTISFAHEVPMTAMKVTGRLASQFIEENLKVREQLVEDASEFLEQELHTAKARLEAQEQGISKFKMRHMGVLPEQMQANLRALDRLQMDLNAAEELGHGLTGRLNFVEKTIKEYEATGTTQTEPGLSSTNIKIDPVVGKLKELEGVLATLSAEYKDTYPDIVRTKKEIENVKAELAEKYGDSTAESDTEAPKIYDPYLRELIKQRNGLRVEVSSIKERQKRLAQQINEYERRVEQTPAREQELMILVRDYENMQKNYQSLLDKRLNARVAENLEKRQKGEQFRILDPANVPEKPEKPNRLKILVLGLLAGCGVGGGLAVFLERVNPTFRRPEAIEALPGVHLLAGIPHFSLLYGRDSRHNGSLVPVAESTHNVEHKEHDGNGKGAHLAIGRWTRKRGMQGGDPNFVCKLHPLSIVAEQYRVAGTRLVLESGSRDSSVVVVTSAVKGEGKTTTVINLGYTLARDLQKQTVMVDCDFRCPELHKLVNGPARLGLTDVLMGEAALDDCLVRIDENDCWVLAVGGRGRQVKELEMVQQLNGLLTKLRQKFEYVVINAPPILPLANMNMVAGLADSIVMVVRAGITPKRVVEQASRMLGGRRQLLVILNAVEVQTMPYYMRYGYDSAGEREASSSKPVY